LINRKCDFSNLEIVDGFKRVDRGYFSILEAEKKSAIVFVSVAKVLADQQKVRFESPEKVTIAIKQCTSS
jgi:hypothetical protein